MEPVYLRKKTMLMVDGIRTENIMNHILFSHIQSMAINIKNCFALHDPLLIMNLLSFLVYNRIVLYPENCLLGGSDKLKITTQFFQRFDFQYKNMRKNKENRKSLFILLRLRLMHLRFIVMGGNAYKIIE